MVVGEWDVHEVVITADGVYNGPENPVSAGRAAIYERLAACDVVGKTRIKLRRPRENTKPGGRITVRGVESTPLLSNTLVWGLLPSIRPFHILEAVD